jgi:peroxiredoxin Q/BCP
LAEHAIKMPDVGESAPDIDRDATGDGRFRLSDHRGQWVVVYFFPRANTPG